MGFRATATPNLLARWMVAIFPDNGPRAVLMQPVKPVPSVGTTRGEWCFHPRPACGRQGPADLSIPQTDVNWKHRPPLVIPTEAYPNFLPHRASNDHGCGSPEREPPALHQRHGTQQEILGERRGATCCSIAPKNQCRLETPPSPGHPDRSVPEFPTSQSQQRPRMRLSIKRAARTSSTPLHSTGNPG